MNETPQQTNPENPSFSINVLGEKVFNPSIEAFFAEHGAYLDELNELLEDSEADNSDEIELFLLLMNDPVFQDLIAQLNSKETIEAMNDFYARTFELAVSKFLPKATSDKLSSNEALQKINNQTDDCIQYIQQLRKGQSKNFRDVKNFMRKFNRGLENSYANMRKHSRIRAFCLQYLLSKVLANIIAYEVDIIYRLGSLVPGKTIKGFTLDASEQIETIKWLYECPPTETTPEELDPYELIADKALKKAFGPIEIDTTEIPGIKKAFIGREASSPMRVKFSIALFPENQTEAIILDVSAFDGSVWNHENDPNKLQFCLEDLALQYGDQRRQAYLAIKDALIFQIAETIENTDSILDDRVESVLEETNLGTDIDENIADLADEITETVFLNDKDTVEIVVEVETDQVEKVLNYRGHARDKDVSTKKITAVAKRLGLEVLKNRGKGSHIAIRNPETGVLKILVTSRYKGGKVRFGFVRKLFKRLGVEREVFLPHFFKSLRK